MLIDGDGNIPSATESIGEDDKIAGAEFDEVGGAFGVGLHLPSE